MIPKVQPLLINLLPPTNQEIKIPTHPALKVEPESLDHAAPGKFHQCGAYGWLGLELNHCNGVCKPVDQADISEDSVKEDPEDLRLDFP